MSDYDLRLVVFDVDGTLVDSIDHICIAVNIAFEGIGKTPPREEVRSIVGLGLEVAFCRLSPKIYATNRDALIEGYKTAYADQMVQKSATKAYPFFHGARAALEALHADPWTLLALATGMSGKGVQQFVKAHNMQNWFSSMQVSDFHPSKPSPEMLRAVLAETGVPVECAVMVGDTVYDMQMAQAAGMKCIAVSWGYHSLVDLESTKPDRIINSFEALPAALDDLLGVTR